MSNSQKSERRGLYSILSRSWAYSAFQRLVGINKASEIIRLEYLENLLASRGQILDIGCGPAQLLVDYPEIDPRRFVGLDPNPDYIERARAHFPDATFFQGTTQSLDESIEGQFEFVILFGVLHHVDDETARHILHFAEERLAPRGTLMTIDPALTEQQNVWAKLLAKADRGRFVRRSDEYENLIAANFWDGASQTFIRTDLLRVPYTHFISVSAKA